MQRKAIAFGFSLMLVLVIASSSFLYVANNASGHITTPTLQTGSFRIENEQFSAYEIRVGETVTITAELRGLVNRNVTVHPIPFLQSAKGTSLDVLDDHTPYLPDPDVWQLVNMSKQVINLPLGETRHFNYTIKGLQTGVYHIDSAFVDSETNTTHVGRGAWILVYPQNGTLPRYDLQVDGQRFNITYQIEPPYYIENILLDKQQKALSIDIEKGGANSSKNQTSTAGLKGLVVWIPKELIRNEVYRDGQYSNNPLGALVDGRALEYGPDYRYWQAVEEDYAAYVLFLPADVSQIELRGTVVIPEFGFVAAFVMAAAIVGAIIAAKRFRADKLS